MNKTEEKAHTDRYKSLTKEQRQYNEVKTVFSTTDARQMNIQTKNESRHILYLHYKS